MVDIFLVSEFFWCTVIFARRGLRLALIYAGGVVTAGYVCFHLSGWLTEKLVPPASPVLSWFAGHVTNQAQSVWLGLRQFSPPVPALSTTGFIHTQWLAYQMLRILFYVAMTLGILLIFIVVSMVSGAILDRPDPTPVRKTARALSWGIAALCGCYVVVLTALVFGNLSWLSTFSGLGKYVQSSVCMTAISHLLTWWKI